ncbi:hypothetical protein [Nocardia sp. NPDC052112]|uniref:hypothetical protein n=1 Tax=Nocardia sp. NPDC052112 TaxID=3155646 RepID=UPI003424EB7C
MTEESAHSHIRPHPVWIVVYIAVAIAGAATRSLSWQAMIMVLVPVAVALILAIRRAPTQARAGAAVRRGVIVWSALLAAVSAWEIYAFVRQPEWAHPSYRHPTLSTLLDPALEHWPLRVVGWLVWLGVGWWLVAR